MTESENAIEDLLRQSRRRPEPPPEVRQRVLAAVDHEWRRQKRKRRWPALALAASLAAIAVIGLMLLSAPGHFPVELAQTESLAIDGATYDKPQTLTIRPGSRVASGSISRFVGVGGVELRLYGDSEFTWHAADSVTLTRGALYIDTKGRSGYRVMTPIGLIEDIGTVFMVAIDGKDVEVAMREGTTRIHTAQGILTATGDREVGDVVRISAQAAITTTEPTSSTRWDWIHGAHPGYRETSVPLLLNAIANDLGRRLAYASPGVEASVQNLRIEGDISQLSPDEALRVVLATSGLTAVADGDHQLVIAFQSSANSQ